MLITIGAVLISALIIANSFALADVIENATLPAPIARAWLMAIVFVPGLGAALWFTQRLKSDGGPGPVASRPLIDEYPNPQDIQRLHEEIDRFRSP